jgi:hypothetical protein
VRLFSITITIIKCVIMQHIKNLSNLIIPELERLPVASKKSGDADDTPPSRAKQGFSKQKTK